MRVWRTVRTLTVVLALAAATSLAAACGGGGEDTAEAQQELCTALGEFGTAVRDLRSLDANSTIEQWDDARGAVSNAWDNVKDQAADVEEARSDEVDSAYDDLESAIDSVPDDTPVDQAVAQVAPQVAALETAWDGYYSGLGCA